MAKQSTLAVKVGIVLIAALTGLIGFSLKSEGRGWFYKGYDLNAIFDTAKGIETGSPVVMAGVPVGRVDRMDLNPKTGKVEIALQIDQPHKVANDALASIRLKTMLGNYQVYITPGTPGAPTLAEGATIQTEPFKDLQDVLAQVGEMSAGPGELFDKIGGIVDENRENIKTATGSLAEVGPKLNELVESLQRLTVDLESGEGTIGKLAKSDELYNKIDSIANDLKSFSERLNSGEGALSKIMADPELANKLDETLTNLNEFSDNLRGGKGTLGRLVNDEALADKIETTFDNASAATQSIKGIVDRNGENIDGTLEHFASIGEKIDEGEGTLAKLINDPEIYNGVRDAVSQIRRTFEEGEEQSVMRTFLGVFFGSVI